MITALLASLLLLELAGVAGAGSGGTEAGRWRPLLSVLGSAGVAIAILWTALRGRPALFPSQREDEQPDPATAFVHLVEWLLWMRWLACAIATILVLLTVGLIRLLPESLLLPILGCLLVLALANLVFAEWLRRRPDETRLQIGVQVAVDLSVLTGLIHFSGGIENPLSLLYLFHVIISGILLSRRACYLVALSSFGLFASMASLEFRELLPHYTLEIFPHRPLSEHGAGESGADDIGHDQGETLHAAHFGPYVLSRILLQAVILLTTGYFVTTIMERLRQREKDARRMAAQEAEARERLESVVEAAGAGLRLLDSELRPVWTNPRFEAWRPDEAEASRIAAATLGDGRSRVTEHLAGPEDRLRHLSLTTAAMVDAGGRPHHVVQLLQDVTARRTAEAEALHAGKLAAVGEMASSIAHEINNPIGILSARLHLLLRKGPIEPERLAEEFRKMVGLTDRITVITRTLLGHVRGGPRPRERLRVAEILERVGILMEAWAVRKRVSLGIDCASGLPPVEGNAGEIEQVLLNLLKNAVDASPPGGRVDLRAEPHAGGDGARYLRLAVEDAGAGVPAGSRERIFEPFFSTKPGGEGTGLGLSISRRIVQEHGGRIRVLDGSVGARFEVDLPAVAAGEAR